MDKFDKWLYFRTVADEDNEDGVDDVLCIPASSVVCITPTSDTAVRLTFKSLRNSHKEGLGPDQVNHDYIALTVDQGKTFEAMSGIIQAINSSGRNDDGFIVIADDATTAYGGAAGTLSKSYISPYITACGAISINDATNAMGLRFPDFGVGGAPTNISATALSVNRHYQSIAAATAMTIPSAAAGNPGDWITVYYNVAAGDTNAHTYTTTTDTTFKLGSTVRTAGGSHADRIPRSDIAVAGDNILTITGATNGDGGVGTYIKFLNVTGAADGWAVEAFVTAQGTGVTAGAAAWS